MERTKRNKLFSTRAVIVAGSRQGSVSTLNTPTQPQSTSRQIAALIDDDEFDPDDIPDDWPSLLYHPFDVHTTQRKIIQITLLNHLIYLTKKKFNGDVKAFLESKKLEIGKIEERNERILEIGKELGEKIDLFQPTLDPSELPESVFQVNDSQITATKYEEQKARATAVGDGNNGQDIYERALRVMMGGRLDAKAQQPLEEDLTKPTWMNEKNESEMSEEEIKELRAFEKKVEALREEKEKTRKALETELKKLQLQISDICIAFDERLQKFFQMKQATDQQIFEAELQQATLAKAILTFEDQDIQESALTSHLETLKQQKTRSTAILTELKADIDKQREEYDAMVAHDKALEKAFRRDFYEKEIEEFYDYLFKVFKRRPKASAVAPPQNNRNVGGDPFDIDILPRSMSLVEDGIEKPEGLDELTWARVLDARAVKISSEQDIKKKTNTLAELVKYGEDMQARDDELKSQFEGILKQLHDYAQYRSSDAQDLELLLKLKQGQVEVEQAPFVTDYSDCVFINKNLIEDYNTNIKTQAKDKVALLKEMKNTKKLIRKKKWENQGMDMQAEDLMEKTKQFQLLRVTKQLQTFIKGGGEDQHAVENATLEKRAEHGQRSHEQKLQEMKKQLAKISKMALEKEAENDRIDGQLAELESATHERQKIYGVQVARRLGPADETDSRLSRLLRGRKLADTVHTQEEHLRMLNTALDGLRKRTFPTFDTTSSAY